MKGRKGTPADKIPGVRKITTDSRCAEVAQLLTDKGLNHLKVLARGDHLVIDSFQLGMADHRGKWEATPFQGTLPELVEMLTGEFSFTLTEF